MYARETAGAVVMRSLPNSRGTINVTRDVMLY